MHCRVGTRSNRVSLNPLLTLVTLRWRLGSRVARPCKLTYRNPVAATLAATRSTLILQLNPPRS